MYPILFHRSRVSRCKLSCFQAFQKFALFEREKKAKRHFHRRKLKKIVGSSFTSSFDYPR
jgi:hypothetical protein